MFQTEFELEPLGPDPSIPSSGITIYDMEFLFWVPILILLISSILSLFFMIRYFLAKDEAKKQANFRAMTLSNAFVIITFLFAVLIFIVVNSLFL